MNFDKESKSDFFFFFLGGGGGGGGDPLFCSKFLFKFSGIIIQSFSDFFCLISRNKVSLGDLHINPITPSREIVLTAHHLPYFAIFRNGCKLDRSILI